MRTPQTSARSQPAIATHTASARSAVGVDRVYRIAAQRAINWRSATGERTNEVTLERVLGVSRTPVREALKRLASDGFVRLVPNRGFLARAWSTDTEQLLAAVVVFIWPWTATWLPSLTQ